MNAKIFHFYTPHHYTLKHRMPSVFKHLLFVFFLILNLKYIVVLDIWKWNLFMLYANWQGITGAAFISSWISCFQKMSLLMTLNLACLIGPVSYVIEAGTMFPLAPQRQFQSCDTRKGRKSGNMLEWVDSWKRETQEMPSVFWCEGVNS